MAWDWNTFFFVLLIGLLLLALIFVFFWFLDLSKRSKKDKGPSHIELYFHDNFRRIMDEWDFTTRDRVKEFKKNMVKRLSKVGSDIDVLEVKRTSLDSRMDTLENKMAKLEDL